MSKKFYAGICIILVVLILGIFTWSYIRLTKSPDLSSVSAQQNIYTVIDSQGLVTVSAKLLNPNELNTDSLRINLSLDTHSENLDDYDFTGNTQIFVDSLVISSGLEVEKQGSGHHVTIILKLPLKSHGSNINLKQVKTIRLVLKNLGQISQRTLTWNLNQKVNKIEGR